MVINNNNIDVSFINILLIGNCYYSKIAITRNWDTEYRPQIDSPHAVHDSFDTSHIFIGHCFLLKSAV